MWSGRPSSIGVLLGPGEIGVPGHDDDQREHRKSEDRWIEDVRAPPVAIPADEFLAEDTQRDHQELQVEPFVLEAQEEVRAQDDRQRAETELRLAAARPGDQHRAGVAEAPLREDQGKLAGDERPRRGPVDVDRRLDECLHVVRAHRVEFDHQSLMADPRAQHERDIPEAEQRRRGQERGLEDGKGSDALRRRQSDEADDESHRQQARQGRSAGSATNGGHAHLWSPSAVHGRMRSPLWTRPVYEAA